ncbi:hypothetical protein TSOC_009983 [Tetrabaena socialis]|uniref:Uncharacterized protein n=1 Tax=Tetrabaena socialis TaxID=47790 RepID=A0A2J7ZUJ5_9CHLO|nr:hypothetical protein TSOC_009983 [Tetrabaena socialis]|eukprot:PNH03900.1 hypothetical protein TSOC_009983 [Tetrabaena socialis]
MVPHRPLNRPAWCSWQSCAWSWWQALPSPSPWPTSRWTSRCSLCATAVKRWGRCTCVWRTLGAT